MGKVTDHLRTLVQKQIEDKGIVVWYDPEGTYADVAANLGLTGVTVLRFEGSFFALREHLEPFLEFVDEAGQPAPETGAPPRVVVYVRRDRGETHFALVEAESAGVVMEPGANPWQRNTRLRVIAERAFKEIAPDRVADIIRQVEQGNLTLADLDQLAEKSEAIGAGAISLVFGTSSPEAVALLLAASGQYDAAIAAKGAMPEIVALLSGGLGVDLDPQAHPSQARLALRRLLLLGDLVAGLPAEDIPSALRPVRLPDRRSHLDALRQVCRTWRNRLDLRGSYTEAARAVETEIGGQRLDLPPRVLAELETFPFIEDRLAGYAEECLLAGRPDQALPLAVRRKESFWPVQDPARQIRWSLLETAARLQLAAGRIRADLRAGKRHPAEMVAAYTQGETPWCLLDTHHRRLERLLSVFDPSLDGEYDGLEQVVHQVRQEYVNIVGSCAEAFCGALEAADFVVEGVLPQDEVFSRLVAPVVDSSGKTAYVLVDALRFEMARDMLEGLTGGSEVSLVPALGQLPGITPVGMAALLPGAERGMELAESGDKVAIRIGTALLKDRASRVKHFRESSGARVVDVKLNDLMRPSKRLQDAITAADVVLVTSQEIDRRGEEAEDEDEARRYMDEVLEKLGRGLRKLAALSVGRVILAADHGYLFAEALSDDRLLPVPDGREVERHRRVWIGRGGATPPNCVRVPASRVGLAGDLELVWPRGYACFRAAGSRAYLHGASSLQEMIVPVAVVKVKSPEPVPEGPGEVKVEMERLRITTRFFSVTVTLVATGLFPANERRVKVTVRAGGRDIGHAVAAAYGFEEGTREIVLQKDRPDAITLMLPATPEARTASAHVMDAVTGIEVAKLENIQVAIAL